MAMTPFPTMPLPRRRSGTFRRVRFWTIAALLCAVAGWVLGLASSPRGWLTVGLAVLLLVLLAAARARGWQQLAGAVVLAAVVAALTAAATGGIPHSPTTPVAPPAAPKTAAVAGFGQGCPPLLQDWGRAWAGCLFKQGNAEADRRRSPTGGDR